LSSAEFRNAFHRPRIGNCGDTQESAEKVIADGHADVRRKDARIIIQQ